MLRRLWQICKDITVWVVRYRSTRSPNEETTVFQYRQHGREVGHITMHKDLKTGKITVNQHGITSNWPRVDNRPENSDAK